MNRSQIAIEIIARITGLPPESVVPEMELVADLDMDSAKALELLVEIEDRLGVEIDDEAAANLNTVGDVFFAIESLDLSSA